MNSELKDKKILILQQRSWGVNIGHFLAKKLQAEGCHLAALTLKRSTHKFITRQTEVAYDLIVNNDEIMSEPKKYLGNDSYSLAQICEELGVDSIWPIVSSLRNFVRTYADKFNYGYKQNVSDEGIIDYVKAIYKYITIIFDEFDPECIITPNFVALPHIMLYLYAKKRGIKMFGVTDCKIKGYYIFSYDPFDSSGRFYDQIDKLNDQSIESPNILNAKKYIKEFREQYKKPVSFEDPNKKVSIIKRLREELSPFKQVISWYLRPQVNHLKIAGITPDFRPPRIILRDHFAHKKYQKFMKNYKYSDFSKINKFAYFPLQVQPEASIDVTAVYFNNQIEVARLVAMSLPDDYVLAVKEHPGMIGYRTPSYIEKLARTPNVFLIDHHILNDEVLKRADLVVSPNSTTVAEAAFYGKPAIQLGNLGTTLKLPNVFKHTDFTTLAVKIKEVLKVNLKTTDYEIRLQNFVAAAFDTGFDLNYVRAWNKGCQQDLDRLWELYLNEITFALKK